MVFYSLRSIKSLVRQPSRSLRFSPAKRDSYPRINTSNYATSRPGRSAVGLFVNTNLSWNRVFRHEVAGFGAGSNRVRSPRM